MSLKNSRKTGGPPERDSLPGAWTSSTSDASLPPGPVQGRGGALVGRADSILSAAEAVGEGASRHHAQQLQAFMEEHQRQAAEDQAQRAQDAGVDAPSQAS